MQRTVAGSDDVRDRPLPLALLGLAGGAAALGSSHLLWLVDRATVPIASALLAFPSMLIGLAALAAWLQRHRGQASALGATAATWSLLAAAVARGPGQPVWLAAAFTVGAALAARTWLLRSECSPASTLVAGTTATMSAVVAVHDLGVKAAGALAAGVGLGGAVAALAVAALLLRDAGEGLG